MSQRGCLILGALVLLPFLIVGLVRMGCKAARRAKYGATESVDTRERAAADLSGRFRVANSPLEARSEFVPQGNLIS